MAELDSFDKILSDIIDRMSDAKDKIEQLHDEAASLYGEAYHKALSECNYDTSNLTDIIYVVRTEYSLGEKCNKCNAQRLIQVDTVRANALKVCECGKLKESYHSKPLNVTGFIDDGDSKFVVAYEGNKRFIYPFEQLCEDEKDFVEKASCFSDVFFVNAGTCENFCRYLSAVYKSN